MIVELKKEEQSTIFGGGWRMELNTVEILSYDASVFTPEGATTRNGCSFCLTLASLPWTAGFGYVNLAAGAAVTIGFALLSEAIC